MGLILLCCAHSIIFRVLCREYLYLKKKKKDVVCRAHCRSLLKLLLILLLSDDSYFDSLLCSFCWSKSLNKYLCLGNLLCSFHFNFWLGTVFISDWGICRLVVLLTILLLQLLLGCLFL